MPAQLDLEMSVTMHPFFNSEAYADLCMRPNCSKCKDRVRDILKSFGLSNTRIVARQLEGVPDKVCDPDVKTFIRTEAMLNS